MLDLRGAFIILKKKKRKIQKLPYPRHLRLFTVQPPLVRQKLSRHIWGHHLWMDIWGSKWPWSTSSWHRKMCPTAQKRRPPPPILGTTDDERWKARGYVFIYFIFPFFATKRLFQIATGIGTTTRRTATTLTPSPLVAPKTTTVTAMTNNTKHETRTTNNESRTAKDEPGLETHLHLES